eukprot:CAMPEP_0185737540 /NCGR_PEP_ID=MMETSP1171-20130828/30612_1 /TAXON_ID=374046 /ORGANISM="Helicotheca tamensis, Strain CCMP826" /LENGTH=130 /DNA_ID=CAMNT_0028408471 /DNA_START=32 /DNA_END=424 /DNA_ORIENTATION=-
MTQPMALPDETEVDIIFDEVDTDGNGVISREEFKAALEKLNFDDLVKIHNIAKANVSRKLDAVEKMEVRLKELEDAYKVKHRAYNNIGFMTADEIDSLFNKSKRTKKDVKVTLGELKDIVSEVHDLFEGK